MEVSVASVPNPFPVPPVETTHTGSESDPFIRQLHKHAYTEDELSNIDNHTDWSNHSATLLESTAENRPPKSPLRYYSVFIGQSLNQASDITKVLRSAFATVEQNGNLICHLETSELRRNRLFGPGPTGFTYLLCAGDYMLHRVVPRLGLTRAIYRFIWPRNHVISRAEALGRLIHAGYSLTTAFESRGRLFIVARPDTNAFVERPAPSEGVLLKMKRIGQFGRPFRIYKIRTMHPYSEYLQEYMHQLNGLEAGGKFKNDFRIISPGRFIRKYWLDEVPMLINLLKGDVKLVGVRPLSLQYFNLYPKEAQQERIRHKPGLVPPYYADLPRNFDEIVESELRYLRAYTRSPFRTDCSYLLKAAYNIFWKRACSK